MQVSKVGNWLQIIGNFGLIAGLVMVAVQIKQNTEIAQAQLISESYRTAMEVPLGLMGENPAKAWSKAIHTPEELTNEDLVVLDANLLKGWLELSRIEILVDSGYAGGVDAPAQLYAWDYLGHTFGSNWWNTRGEWTVAPAPQARETINRELAGVENRDWIPPSLQDRYHQLRPTKSQSEVK